MVGKRIILTSSLIHPCENLDRLPRLVVLDVDAGSIPRSAEGLMLTGVQPRFSTRDYKNTPVPSNKIELTGPKQVFTRHIEAKWDAIPERLLLCIHTNGRRVGSINPAHTDYTFWQSSARAHLDASHDTTAPIYAHAWK